MKEKKDPATLEAFFSLVLLIFLLCNPRFPFAYKRGTRPPYRGSNNKLETLEHDTSTQLTAAIELPSTRDL